MPKRQLTAEQQKHLAANVKAKRGTTRAKELLAGTNISPTRLSLWETAAEEIGIEGLIRLAVLLQCPVDDFLVGLDDDYDRIIEMRIAVDVRSFYERRIKQLEDAFARFVRVASEGAPTHEPRTALSSDAGLSADGKSRPTRARRTRKTKTKPKTPTRRT